MEIRSLKLSVLLFVMAIVGIARADFVELTESGISDNNGNPLIRESWGAVSCDWNKDGYIDIVLNNHRDEMRIYQNDSGLRFQDRTELISNPVVDADEHGIVCADFYPGDGYLEIAVTAGGRHNNPRQLRKFYRYDTQIDKFVDISEAINFKIKNHPGRSLLIADFNGDHRLDLFESARKHPDVSPPASRPYMYSSDEDKFVNMPDPLNSACERGVVEFSKYVDFDKDGIPEIACTAEVAFSGLFEIDKHSSSNAHFNNIWNEVSPDEIYEQVKDLVVADFNNDDLLDMFVARKKGYPGNAALLEGEIRARLVTDNNNKEITFYAGDQVVTLDFATPYLIGNRQVFYGENLVTDGSLQEPWINLQTIQLDPEDPRYSGTAASFSNEGLYIGYDGRKWHVRLSSISRQQFDGHFYAAEPLSELVMENFDPLAGAIAPLLLLNTGSGFSNVAEVNGFEDALSNLAVEGGDFDNDGDIDLFIIMSNAPEDYSDRFYENDGHGSFALKQLLPAVNPGVGENVSVADYDMDGCLDLTVVNGHGEKPNQRGRVQLLRGQCDPGNSWVQFDLSGNTPHGLGAIVEVVDGNKHYRKLQDGGARRFGQNAQRLHFGLGANVAAVDVNVYWEDGAHTMYSSVPTNSVYLLDKGGNYANINSPVPYLTVGDTEVDEDKGSVDVVVSLSKAATESVVFNYSTKDISATASEDYVGETRQVGTINAGEYVTHLRFQILSDDTVEGDEQFQVTILDATNARILDDQAVVTITENEIVNDSVKLHNALYLGSDNRLWVKATSDHLPLGSATLTATARLNGDEKALGQIPWRAEKNAYQTNFLGIESTPDCVIVESNFGGIDNMVLGTTGSCEPAVTTISIHDISVGEDSGIAEVRVALSRLDDNDVYFDYATSDVEASAGEDYISQQVPGQIIPAGQLSVVLPVSILSDDLAEGAETFRVSLSSVQNAAVMDGEAVVTILDGDSQIDEVSLINAVYFPSQSRIWIKVLSDHVPLGSASLTASATYNDIETVLGEVSWRADKNAYQTNFYGLESIPDCVIVRSNQGGQDKYVVNSAGSCGQ